MSGAVLGRGGGGRWGIPPPPPPPPPRPPPPPPANPTNQTGASFSFTDTQAGVSFLCQLDGAAFSACSSPVTYPGPLTQASHSFSVKAQDTVGNQSAAASFTWTVDTTPPSNGSLTATPPSPTHH